MRVKYQVAIGALPIGLMFASFLPLFFLASWLPAALGIEPDTPLNTYPNAGLWIAGLLGVMVVFMLLGYVLGWVANAAISRLVLGWPNGKVSAVYLHSDVPSHWLKSGTAPSLGANAQVVEKWEAQRKIGAVRFIFTRGVLAWGAPMLLAMYVAPTLAKGESFSFGLALFNLVLWAVAGAGFGAAIWFSSESNYRKAKERR